MPFIGEPTNDQLTFDTDRLVVRPIEPGDGEDAYELLTHGALEFMDPTLIPPSPRAYDKFAQRIQDRVGNDQTFRLYQWSLRLKESDVLVGLVSAELRRGDRLRLEDSPLEVREFEVTAYIHPDHQHLGYASEANIAISGFVEPEFEVNRRVAKIRHDNVDVQRKAASAGGEKLVGQTQQGYETWVIYDNVGD
jgi:RimJ/RimL family protein N-acetyltransferase